MSVRSRAKADMFIITSAFISVNIIVLIIINKEDLRHRFGCSISLRSFSLLLILD